MVAPIVGLAPVQQHGSNAQPVLIQTPATAPLSGSSLLVGSVNLLDWSDEAPSQTLPQQAARPSARLVLKDLSPASITAGRFQQLWGELPEAFNGPIFSLASAASATVADYEALLREEKVWQLDASIVAASKECH